MPAASTPAEALSTAFRGDVLRGLSQPRKTIPARWLYDNAGSEWFEKITALDEYYPTRTEIGILKDSAAPIAEIVGEGRAVVEFGAGSATKTPILLDALAPSAYVPLDISGEFLREACRPLEARYPDLPIFPLEADFTKPARLPAKIAGKPLLGFFPGSTIGNMEPAPAVDLLRSMRDTLGDESWLVIGMDRIKDREVLEAAYDDREGVTAAFNLNLLDRINRELDGTIPVDAFRHRAIWNDMRARIEMHLEATRAVEFEVADERFAMEEGETIHTENSHKYGKRSGALLLLAGGWETQQLYSDADGKFMVMLARALGDELVA